MTLIERVEILQENQNKMLNRIKYLEKTLIKHGIPLGKPPDYIDTEIMHARIQLPDRFTVKEDARE